MFISRDIIFHVLDYLCDGHLLPLMGVSSLWRQMALDRVKELKITCSRLHEMLLLVANCNKVTSLEVNFMGGDQEQSINSFIELPSTLTHLRCVGSVPEWWLAAVSKRLPNLAFVVLCANSVATGEFLIGMPLVTIELSGCL